MRVRIVKSEDTWILRRVAESIRIPGVTVSMVPDPLADINFYVAYHGMEKPVPGTKNVVWMTHLPANIDDGGFRRKRFFEKARMADHCIAMSKKTAESLRPAGVSVSIWGGAPDAQFVKLPIVLGVAAKLSRRKRPDRITALKQIPGVEVRVTGGGLSIPELVDWYRGLDYLVVTSDTEGGPYPVLEALASGVPIIAPDVGWCWEYPVLGYDGTTESLVQLVRRLVPDADPWATASAELEQIFQSLLSPGPKMTEPNVAHFSLKPGGPELPYFYHPHNCGLERDRRRTERTVELAVADAWLKKMEADATCLLSSVMEVGAVTPYYWPGRIDAVVDPADDRGRIKKSLFDVDFTEKDVLSLSTLEHIGESRYGFQEAETSQSAFYKILNQARRFLISVPYGWESPQFLPFQQFVLENCHQLELQGVKTYVLNRRDDETWEPSHKLQRYGKPPKPWANTVIFLEKGGLL